MAKKKTTAKSSERGKKAAPAPADSPRYPNDLGLRWFHQKANLPDEVMNPVDDEEIPAGRLRLTRTNPGGWGKAH